MTTTDFIDTFRELIQTDTPVTLATPLADVEEWDSMAIMAVIAYLDVEHQTQASYAELKDLKTVGDIARLVPGLEE